MPTTPTTLNAQRTSHLLWRLDYWFDRIEAGDLPDSTDWARDWLNSHSDIATWPSAIGRGRELLAATKRDAPEATVLHGWLESRLDIYVGHVAWVAQHALLDQGHGWSESVATGLDTGVLHGPAGRDIGWGLTPIPRLED